MANYSIFMGCEVLLRILLKSSILSAFVGNNYLSNSVGRDVIFAKTFVVNLLITNPDTQINLN